MKGTKVPAIDLSDAPPFGGALLIWAKPYKIAPNYKASWLILWLTSFTLPIQ